MLVLPGFLLPFALLKAVLAVVHELTHRRDRLGRDLYQVQALFISDAQGLICGHNAQLFSAAADQAQFLVSNVLIQLMHCNANNRSTSYHILPFLTGKQNKKRRCSQFCTRAKDRRPRLGRLPFEIHLNPFTLRWG